MRRRVVITRTFTRLEGGHIMAPYSAGREMELQEEVADWAVSHGHAIYLDEDREQAFEAATPPALETPTTEPDETQAIKPKPKRRR